MSRDRGGVVVWVVGVIAVLVLVVGVGLVGLFAGRSLSQDDAAARAAQPATSRPAPTQAATQPAAPDPYAEAEAAVNAVCLDLANFVTSTERNEYYLPALAEVADRLYGVVVEYRKLSQPAADLSASLGVIVVNAQGWSPGGDVETLDLTRRLVEEENYAMEICSKARTA